MLAGSVCGCLLSPMTCVTQIFFSFFSFQHGPGKRCVDTARRCLVSSCKYIRTLYHKEMWERSSLLCFKSDQ